MLVQRREQEHRNAAAGDEHLAAVGDEGLGLRREQVAHLVGERLRFIGLEDLPGLELHCVHADNAPFEAVFVDLVVKPRDVARIDGDDADALAELQAVEH